MDLEVNKKYPTGVVQKLRLMWIEIFTFFRTIQTNVLSPNHLLFTGERNTARSLQILCVIENQDNVSLT